MDDAYNNKNLVLKDEDDEEDPSNDLDYIDQRIEDLIETETKKSSTKLDYSLQTKEERNALVTKIIAETPPTLSLGQAFPALREKAPNQT